MISNRSFSVLTNHGLAKFPIQQTSESLAQHGMLFKTVGGILIPTNSRLRRIGLPISFQRLLNRSQSLPTSNLIVNSYLGEFFWQTHLLLKRKGRFFLIQRLMQYLSFILVDALARRILVRSRVGEIQLYHCRSGFGGRSLIAAKRLGIPTLCEHTTAHPDFRLLNIEQSKELSFSIDKLMRHDLKSADYLLVPSEWVKETIMEVQNAPDISVLTPPIDHNFRDYLTPQDNTHRDIDVLFVGYVSKLKGFHRFLSIIENLDPSVKITIAGSWDPRLSPLREQMIKNQNVEILDFVEHANVANLMARSKILLFPSQNEGAARVVEEAMHAGVLVMATQVSFANSKESAIYIDSMSDCEVSEKIEHYLNSPKSRCEITNKAKANLVERDSIYFECLLRIYEKTQNR
jgi:glycosyltransferase involved in cell wall biosynthesis